MTATNEITVLMSCYNAQEFLEQSIQSILSQTFTNFEFIIVNDGSRDDTGKIIEKYAAIDNRIKILNKVNTGLTDSLNRGLGLAKGRAVARIDADDVSMPERLELQFRHLVRNRLCLVGSDFRTIDENGALLGRHRLPRDHKSLVRLLERQRPFFPHSSAMFLRNVAKKLGSYRKNFVRSQDWDLWLRLSEHGAIGAVERQLVDIRKHPNILSNIDSGRTQRIMSMAATVGHYARTWGLKDPSEGDVREFREFAGWVAEQMESDGYLDASDAYSVFSKAVKEKQYSELFERLKSLETFKLLVTSIARRMIGTGAAQRYADRWFESSKL